MAAHQAPSLGFSRQEHWSGLPFPSPMHESEKWKGSRSVVSDLLLLITSYYARLIVSLFKTLTGSWFELQEPFIWLACLFSTILSIPACCNHNYDSFCKFLKYFPVVYYWGEATGKFWDLIRWSPRTWNWVFKNLSELNYKMNRMWKKCVRWSKSLG